MSFISRTNLDSRQGYSSSAMGDNTNTSLAPFLDNSLHSEINRSASSNSLSGRKHIKQKEEDIAICECKYDANDPDSACGERCLNVLTSTECTPGYCPCSNNCKNQRFQTSEYAKTKLFKTEGRGWGLLADENIKAGQFIIEYCGEVISSEAAKERSHTYETEGLRDAYIISLNANYFIDATNKGSLARFINHSCQPNCETRKWTVLGETRVGIFAKQDISVGTELAYDYNFEWYGGANVRCLCGAPNCSIFLGAKSQGFQEHNHVWEDGDDRYEVEEIPIYDSAEDEPLSKLPKSTSSIKLEPIVSGNNDYSVITDGGVGSEQSFESTSLIVESLTVPVEGVPVNAVKTEMTGKTKLFARDTQQVSPQTNGMISDESNCAWGKFNIGARPASQTKSAQRINNRKSKYTGRKQVDGKNVAKRFASKQAQEEIIKYEEVKNEANAKLDALYDEIRPVIEQHERDSQDSVPTSVAKKWIAASCAKLRADFDFHHSVVKNVVCPPQTESGVTNPSEGGGNENADK